MEVTTLIIKSLDDMRVSLSTRLDDVMRAVERQNSRIGKLEDSRTFTTETDDIVRRVKSLEDDRLRLVTLVSMATASAVLFGDRIAKWLFG